MKEPEIIKSAIVTGPTGVIGTALIEKLISEKIHVFAVIRPDSNRLNVLQNNQYLSIIFCDLENLKSLKKIIEIKTGINDIKVDAFFHLGWLGTGSRENRFDMYLQTKNINLSLDAVEVAREFNCKVFIGSGSQAEYGNVPDGILRVNTFTKPESGYGMAKLCAGQMTCMNCKKYGIRHIWPRILSIYGRNDGKQTFINSAITKIKAGERFSMTAGEQEWDYLYSKDAAEALYDMALFGKDGAIYPLGSGNTRSLHSCVDIIKNIINPNSEIGYGEIPYLKDQVMKMKADISELTKDTGWLPKTSFYDGIREIINN